MPAKILDLREHVGWLPDHWPFDWHVLIELTWTCRQILWPWPVGLTSSGMSSRELKSCVAGVSDSVSFSVSSDISPSIHRSTWITTIAWGWRHEIIISNLTRGYIKCNNKKYVINTKITEHNIIHLREHVGRGPGHRPFGRHLYGPGKFFNTIITYPLLQV